MKKILIVLCLMFLPGCIQDDIDEVNDKLTTIGDVYVDDMNLNNRSYYAAGVRDGFIMMGMNVDEAIVLSEEVADHAFGVVEVE
jgi:hypothetical protein